MLKSCCWDEFIVCWCIQQVYKTHFQHQQALPEELLPDVRKPQIHRPTKAGLPRVEDISRTREMWTKGDQGSNISDTLWKLLPPHCRCGAAQPGQTAWIPFYKNIHYCWVSFWMPALAPWLGFVWTMSICDSSNFPGSRTVCFNS